MSTLRALSLAHAKPGYTAACFFLLSVLLGLNLSPALYAQAVANASVTGQILDPSGAAVAGAKVKMIETDKGISHEATTDAGGRYTLPNLSVGPYRLEASASGFKTFLQSGIVLQVGDNPELNAKLQVGAITENVEVSAGAAMVQAEQTSVSQVINQKSIVELPLNGRQPTQLVLISGASVVAPAGDMSGSKNYFSSGTIFVGGGQANGTNYLLDGGDNLDTMTNVNLPFPFPDALQEFSVDTSALPARNGTQPGGLVNIVTKSGANSYHGDLFEFLRNGDLNARNAFSIAQDTLKRNQFGGTIGGKIIRDKLFFFGGYQGTRIVSVPPNSIAYVPTPLELAGNFSVQASAACQSSGKAKTLINPVNGKQFAGNQIPTSLFDPAALKLTSYLPASANQCGQVTYAIPTIQNEDQGIGRIDWVQSSKHALFGRYFITKYRNPAFSNPTNILVTQNPGLDQGAQSFTLGDTYSISATTLNSFHATFTRRTDIRSAAADQINARDLGVNIYTYVPNDLRVTVNNDLLSAAEPALPDTLMSTPSNLPTMSTSSGAVTITALELISFALRTISSPAISKTATSLSTGRALAMPWPISSRAPSARSVRVAHNCPPCAKVSRHSMRRTSFTSPRISPSARVSAGSRCSSRRTISSAAPASPWRISSPEFTVMSFQMRLPERSTMAIQVCLPASPKTL